VLSEHGCPIAPSTYYDAASRKPSPRARRDEQLKAAIVRVHQGNYGVSSSADAAGGGVRLTNPRARATLKA
jgi:putative transposase